MSTVYLFGAGASHGYVGSKTGVRPPLANSYFSTFEKLLISGDFEVKIGEIVNYVRDTRGIPPELQPTDFNENIETIFAEVERNLRQIFENNHKVEEENLVIKKFGLVKTYDQFVFWFAHVLNEIQNGEIDDCYEELISRTTSNDIFITFNWDTLLDRALYNNTNWCPDDGYGFIFDGMLDGNWREPEKSKSERTLLKLHGSTNWFGAYITRHFQTGERAYAADNKSANKKWCLVDGRSHFSAYKNRWRPGYDIFSYFFPPNDPISNRPLMPIIVPPQEQKDFAENADIFNPIWSSAYSALKEADKLIVCGYSFPETDGHAFSLLDEFVKGGGKEITVIDPYPDGVVKRISPHLSESIDLSVFEGTLREWLELPEKKLPKISEHDKILEGTIEPKDANEDIFRKKFLISQLIEFNLSRIKFDVTLYNKAPILNCSLPGEFATHLYGAYRPEVSEYRLNSINLKLPNGDIIYVSIHDIWTLLPIGKNMLTEEEIAQADISDLDEGIKSMIEETYQASGIKLDWYLKRFVASPDPTHVYAAYSHQAIKLIHPSGYS